MKEEVNQARWIGILAATGLALYLCWLMLRPFIGVLEWAAVLVIVFYPVHKRLAKKIRRRGLSALLSCSAGDNRYCFAARPAYDCARK